MLFRKNNEKARYVKLSDFAVSFIKNTVLSELSITPPIGTQEICAIEDWLHDLELLEYDGNGDKIQLEEPLASKLIMAKELLAEFMGIWGGDNTTEDLDDLNQRLGFLP